MNRTEYYNMLNRINYRYHELLLYYTKHNDIKSVRRLKLVRRNLAIKLVLSCTDILISNKKTYTKG